MNYFEQTANETLAYRQDITGDTITSASWTISPGATLSTQELTDTSTTVMISGLTPGTIYTVDVVMHCGSGQIIERQVTISCP